MFLTKKHISRRTFIRSSVGATLALPLLDAMVPAQTPLANTAAAPLQRFGFIYVPHGSIMKEWTPLQDGAGFDAPDSQTARTVPVTGERADGVEQQRRERPLGQHRDVAQRHVPAKGSVIHLNTTVDQLIAQQVGQSTPFPSIELATEDHSSHLGSCARRLPLLI
jgi:hypothetical protein